MTILTKNIQFVVWVRNPLIFSDFIIPCPSWSFLLVLVPSVGFPSIIVSGSFSVSRGMRLWETDLPNPMIFDDAFVWTISNCVRSIWAIWASWESSRHIICGFWSASSIHANNAVHHWIHIAVVGTLLTASAQSTYPLSFQDAKERPRECTIINFDRKYNGKLMALLQTTCKQIRVSSSALCELLNFFGNDQESTSSCWSFWWHFWHWNVASVTDEHHAWEFFNSFHVLFCPCKFSSSQLRLSDGIGSKFHVYKLLSVSRSMLETSEFCPQVFWSVASGPFKA